MMRLIDADALMDLLGVAVEYEDCSRKSTLGCKEGLSFMFACKAITYAPAIDAVEVVRCRDCKWHEQEQPGMVYCPRIVGNWVEDGWFCADGEEREDETAD